ncbi:MAG: MFS transporter [Chloroflexi bacterium]|nr:MFS transporter [Chloroflexota bacterium]
MQPSSEPYRLRLPLSQLVTLSIYWFGIQTIWGGLNITIIPGRLDDMSRDAQGTLLALIMVAGAVAPIIVQPTVGVISDYTVTRWGRRKPYIVIGTLLDIVFLAGLAMNNDFVAMVAFYFLLQVSSNFAQGPFQGYVPDLVPAKQVGLASGLMGLMLTLGTIAASGSRRSEGSSTTSSSPRWPSAWSSSSRWWCWWRRSTRDGARHPGPDRGGRSPSRRGVATSSSSATSSGSSWCGSSSWVRTTPRSSPSATSVGPTASPTPMPTRPCSWRPPSSASPPPSPPFPAVASRIASAAGR